MQKLKLILTFKIIPYPPLVKIIQIPPSVSSLFAVTKGWTACPSLLTAKNLFFMRFSATHCKKTLTIFGVESSICDLAMQSGKDISCVSRLDYVEVL